MKIKFFTLLIAGLWLSAGQAQDNLTYQKPPQEILELLEAKNTPQVVFTQKTKKMLLLERPDFLTIEEVAQPVIGLAGLRINPRNSTSIGGSGYTNIQIQDLTDNSVQQIKGLPENLYMTNIQFNADESKLSFLQVESVGVSLWVIDMDGLRASRVGDFYLNQIFGSSVQWKDLSSLYVLRIPERGEAPVPSEVPTGPIVQENLGKAAPSRTYQNLLKNEDDVRLFDYFASSQLSIVTLDGHIKDIGTPAHYRQISLSPDNKYVLTTTIQKPYSYLVPVYSFPYQVNILDENGNLVKHVYDAPLADNVPLGFDSTVPGPRNFFWRANEPATLMWVRALDEGNGRKAVEFRDEILQWKAPFADEASVFLKTELRFGGLNWFDRDYAVLSERLASSRQLKVSLIDHQTGAVVKTIDERSSEDAYADPGRFVYTDNAFNHSVILKDKGSKATVFTISEGASPEGDRPFLMKWDLLKGKKDTLFKSQAPYYEYPVFFQNLGEVYLSRESQSEVPNYFRQQLKSKKLTALTTFENPYPSLEGVAKEQISYPREDGVTLTGTLYLPKGYNKGEGKRLPLLMWAYPREFKNASAAAQIKGSPYRYTRLSWGSPIYWVNRGYAILDNADMPIVGEGDDEPNDTFVEQIQANAEAAISNLDKKGIIDPQRVGVGGHSYGAFMTANLLAHTNLFAAGLARSGAYNRTFTPFGFQYEQRTYWEAPEVYFEMSPFSFAHKIKTPLLMIHGMDDENSGTFPIQSERLYNAIKGHGGTTRLVFLPKEFHGYRAKESIMHTLWEMDQWLEKYVKNKK